MEVREIDIQKARLYLEEKEKLLRQRKKEQFNRIIATLKKLTPIWEKYRLKKVYLYGSAVEGRFFKGSDIDIAVDGRLGFQDLVNLYTEIDRNFSTDIDVRNLEDLPFKEKVLERGVIVYEK